VIPLAEVLLRRFAAYDQPFADWCARRPEGVPSCSRGCSACCELLCLITWPEAALLAEDLRARGLVARLAPALADQARRASFDGVDARTYFDARVPCALLEADHTCAVYAARPAACRYHVAFSPACRSARSRRRSGPRRAPPAILREVLLPILDEMAEQVGEEAREAGPLPVMVLAALRDLGEDVQMPITPAVWLARFGARVWAYHRNEKRRAAGGSR
jgi:Fe-S-cluster containining protein